MQVRIPSQIWFIYQYQYHYAVSIIYITFYCLLVLLISFCFQWKIKTILSKTESSFHLQQLSAAIGEEKESFKPNINANVSPSSSQKVFFKEKVLIKQSLTNAWWSSLIDKHNIYRIIFMDLATKALQMGVVFKLFIIYHNIDDDEQESIDNDDEEYLLRIILYISALIYCIYKVIACITVYIVSHRCLDIVLELFNFTFLRCLYVNYRLYSRETSAPQKFLHLLHSSLKTSSLLLLFLILLLRTDNKHIRYDAFIICCIALSFVSLFSSIISADSNIMKQHWRSNAFDCINCRLDIKYLCRSLIWRFSEITHRIILLLFLYISFELNIFIIIVSIEYTLCFILFCYNRSVLVLGSIFFYHVTAGKYFGGGPLTKQIGYYIFVIFSIYRFLSSFLYLVFLTMWHFIDFNVIQQPNAPDTAIKAIVIYEWITLILWILSMFYVTEKGSRAVYNDQLLAPLAIYQQFVQLLDFIVFGASINDLVTRRYDHDNKNIMQYLCSTTNKLTLHSQARLDIIRNILFKDKDIYKAFLFEKNDKNQMCLHYAVTANQLNIVKFFTESCAMDINVADDNDQTCLHIAIERSYIEIVKYFVSCRQLDITAKDTMNRTYLHFAAMSQSLQIIKCFDLVNGDRVSYNAIDDYGKTMLFYAESKPVIKHLLELHKMDVNAIDFDGKSILFHSINDDKFELTTYLIEECNVDIQIRDNNGNLAFFYAQNIEMADYMMNTCNMDCNAINDDQQSVIFNAISSHYSSDLCKYYIETCDVNINQMDKHNQSLLDIAVQHLNITQVKYLLNERNMDNTQNMIHIKTWCCSKDTVIKSLFELFELGVYGIDNILNAVKRNGIHNIHYMLQSMWHVRQDQILLEFGLGIIYQMLKKKKELIDIQDDEQNTPIFYCIDSDVFDLVVLFAENGADLNHRNSFYESPLEHAIQKCKSADIRDYLTETQYNSPYTEGNIQNGKGTSPSPIHQYFHTSKSSVEMHDIPQVLLQKTVEYLSDDVKHSNDDHDKDDTEDIEAMLDDIDMDNLVEILEEDDDIDTKIEEDDEHNIDKELQDINNHNIDKESQDINEHNIDKESQDINDDDIDAKIEEDDAHNIDKESHDSDQVVSISGLLVVLDSIHIDTENKESDDDDDHGCVTPLNIETTENIEEIVDDDDEQKVEIHTDITTVNDEQNEIKENEMKQDIDVNENVEHVEAIENENEKEHQSENEIALV